MSHAVEPREIFVPRGPRRWTTGNKTYEFYEDDKWQKKWKDRFVEDEIEESNETRNKYREELERN